VGWLDEMDQLMSDDILQASQRLFRELGVQPNSVSGPAAASPLGFHSLNVYTFNRNTELLLPLLQQRRQLLSNLLSVIFLNELSFSFLGRLRPNAQGDATVSRFDPGRCIVLDKLQQITFTSEIVALAIHEIAGCFALLADVREGALSSQSPFSPGLLPEAGRAL
jgi:hypothetical protein